MRRTYLEQLQLIADYRTRRLVISLADVAAFKADGMDVRV